MTPTHPRPTPAADPAPAAQHPPAAATAPATEHPTATQTASGTQQPSAARIAPVVRRVAVVLAVALVLAGPAAPLLAGPAVAGACASAADFDGDGVDDVVAGDPFADGGRGAVYVISRDRAAPVAVPGLARGDGLGWSVRLARVDGDACSDLVIGAPYADVDGRADAGAVYVVHGGGGRPPERLTAPEPQQGAHFGWSLAARGGLVAVGAPYEDDGGRPDAGAVYVRRGTNRLTRIGQDSPGVPGNSEPGDQFGWSLAFGPGNGLVVGVPYENDDGAGRQAGSGVSDSGAAVFLDDVLASPLSGTKLDSPADARGDRYGYAVAYVEGRGYAVGAPGSGYVQLLDQGRRQVRRLSQEEGGRAFGFSLAASADGRLAIGAPYGGGVRVVSWADPGEERRLPGGDGLFGWSVAFSGNKLYVGQPDARPYGRVVVAARNAQDPVPVQPPAGVDFGAAVAG
uniref:FG-GAP repeat protein n=1 Tax=Nonomuraea pusilla TaxID=46177 RepID=UPI000AD2B17C|nr:FG-GAP repeat protein [Nonomuraea pusilla]